MVTPTLRDVLGYDSLVTALKLGSFIVTPTLRDVLGYDDNNRKKILFLY